MHSLRKNSHKLYSLVALEISRTYFAKLYEKMKYFAGIECFCEHVYFQNVGWVKTLAFRRILQYNVGYGIQKKFA